MLHWESVPTFLLGEVELSHPPLNAHPWAGSSCCVGSLSNCHCYCVYWPERRAGWSEGMLKRLVSTLRLFKDGPQKVDLGLDLVGGFKPVHIKELYL